MNNFIKLLNSPRILTIIPPFLLYILAPNKIKRPILRKKGGLLTVALLVCYCPKIIMPFYLRNHAIGFYCILLKVSRSQNMKPKIYEILTSPKIRTNSVILNNCISRLGMFIVYVSTDCC